jgi:hypothetical protein
VRDLDQTSEQLAKLAKEANDIIGPETHYSEQLAVAKVCVMLRAGQYSEVHKATQWDAGDKELTAQGWTPEGCSLQRRLTAGHWVWWLRAQAYYHAAELADCAKMLLEGVAALQAAPGGAAGEKLAADEVMAVPGVAEVQAALQHVTKLQQLKEEGNRWGDRGWGWPAWLACCSMLCLLRKVVHSVYRCCSGPGSSQCIQRRAGMQALLPKRSWAAARCIAL